MYNNNVKTQYDYSKTYKPTTQLNDSKSCTPNYQYNNKVTNQNNNSKSYTPKYQNIESRTPYSSLDDKLSYSSYKNNKYIVKNDPPINYINNYETKCIYRINMNNYYKNINIYNYKKKIFI